MVALPAVDIRRAVRMGLEEDLAQGDITTTALFSEPTPARAKIIAQQSLVVAGMAAAIQTFIAVDASLTLTPSRRDGSHAKNGDVLLQIEGDGRSILMAERVALNFLQYLSGIATLTSRFCHAVHGYPVDIMDTRKTLPGWRAIQKWAVSLGGGTNHRVSLGDGILIKDNHLALMKNKKAGCPYSLPDSASNRVQRQARNCRSGIVIGSSRRPSWQSRHHSPGQYDSRHSQASGETHRRSCAGGSLGRHHPEERPRHGSGRPRPHLHRSPHPFSSRCDD